MIIIIFIIVIVIIFLIIMITMNKGGRLTQGKSSLLKRASSGNSFRFHKIWNRCELRNLTKLTSSGHLSR